MLAPIQQRVTAANAHSHASAFRESGRNLLLPTGLPPLDDPGLTLVGLGVTAEAERLFGRIFQACARRIEARWCALLEEAALAEHLAADELPHGFDFDAQRAEMDKEYFGIEDEGRVEMSVAYFAHARLMSALSFAVAATDATDSGRRVASLRDLAHCVRRKIFAEIRFAHDALLASKLGRGLIS